LRLHGKGESNHKSFEAKHELKLSSAGPKMRGAREKDLAAKAHPE